LERIVKNEKCWEWRGSKDKDGYAIFNFRGKTKKAHRISWQYFKGTNPENFFVLHACDNPPCTNPEHLFLGTAADNLRDMIKKGRRVAAKGEKAWKSKLKNEQVIEIRELVKLHPLRSLARKYGVDNKVIRDIRDRKTWKHLNP
jgi:hypothetical protein